MDDPFLLWDESEAAAADMQHFLGAQAPSSIGFRWEESPAATVDVADLMAPASLADPLLGPVLERPSFPCLSCAIGGCGCSDANQACDGRPCSSCVGLGIHCSLLGFVPDPVPPPQPWPQPGADNAPDEVDAAEASACHPSAAVSTQELLDSLLANPSAQSLDPDLFTDMDLLAWPPADDQAEASAIAAPQLPDPDPDLAPGPLPKTGARFSRESVRILRAWLASHCWDPYPDGEQRDLLQRQTGLSKTQITNWFANARRRGKVRPPRSISPQVSPSSGRLVPPPRRPTPALDALNPLERWQNSPPEDEPASATAIARAVTASSSWLQAPSPAAAHSPPSFNNTHTDDAASSRSTCNRSSASSLTTSRSSTGSHDSVRSHRSHASHASFGSTPLFASRRRRRRRRRPCGTPQPLALTEPGPGASTAAAAQKTFQCTFCAETFRTKHDWQRHEKSLHLSLERWVCAPDGPRALNPDTGRLSCVFCGLADPDDAHLESHGDSSCRSRSLEERTFYRKDHLAQHLRLVHDAKFVPWSMKSWKVATPEIRSRCGFCGSAMDTWTIRVDHLADHFKSGASMSDWKGDWGFDSPVLDMVENSIAPGTASSPTDLDP